MPTPIIVGRQVISNVPDPKYSGFAGEHVPAYNRYPGAVPVPGNFDLGSVSNPVRPPMRSASVAEPDPNACPICSRVCSTAFALKGHMSSHAPKRAKQRRKKRERKARNTNGDTKLTS